MHVCQFFFFCNVFTLIGFFFSGKSWSGQFVISVAGDYFGENFFVINRNNMDNLEIINYFYQIFSFQSLILLLLLWFAQFVRKQAL